MMIRNFEPQHLDKVMKIWLDTNTSAHPFIEKTQWIDTYDSVRDALPSADLFVYEEKGIIKGFIGITDNTYIAGLFVDQRYQSQGIGQKLLDHCKSLYSNLELDVFVENDGAVRFYVKNGFATAETKLNHDFKHEEYHMIWSIETRQID